VANSCFSEIHFVTPLRGLDAQEMLIKFVPSALTDRLRQQWARIGELGFNSMFTLGNENGFTWHLGLHGKEGYFCLRVMHDHSRSNDLTLFEGKAIEAAALARAGKYPKGWMWVSPSGIRDDDAFMQRVYGNIAAGRHWSHGL